MLATKLSIPPLRPKIVLRPRLIERLNDGLQRKLTLIAAPAGFGKTTLVSEWVSHFRFTILDPSRLAPAVTSLGLDSPEQKSIPNPQSKIQNQVAWLSLDEGDDDLIRFLTHFVAALQTIAVKMGEGNFGKGVLAVLQSVQPPRDPSGRESILTLLLNEISTLSHHFVLVLDDYHVIETAPNGRPPLGAVDLALAFLLEHLPPQMHLVIVTREDPHLPLARLRAQGQLSELRAADLRFTPAEAAEFLNQVMGLNLSPTDIAALEDRTEGWIAGLQLAALSVQGRQDVAGFIQSFAGDNRYIVDYLVEEVLQRQPEPVRSFLLQTAILDRLSGSLCDAVTGREGGHARLEALERGNFFLVPLDDKRHWYRYHKLFAEVLNTHLRAEQPNQIATLHRRASEWYEQHSAADAAIRHALAAADFERAADLVERVVPAMRRSRQDATLLGWFQALPDELVRTRPILSVHYAGALLAGGEIEGGEARLRDAERWLDSEMGAVVVDKEELRHLPGLIAMFRAAHTLLLGDLLGTVKYAQRALDLVVEDDQIERGAATALLGLAYWASGDLAAAHQTYASGMARVQKAGHLSDAISGTIALADIRIAQGRLYEAMGVYEQALQLATAQHPDFDAIAPSNERAQPVLRGTADLYVGIAELQREHNDLNAATQNLLHSKVLGERIGFPPNPSRWRVALARIREAQGDLDGALNLLQEAERLYVSDFFPNVRPVAAVKTRLWVAQGRLGEALGWVRAQGLSVTDDLSYLREFEHITLARVLLAQSKHSPADRFLIEAMEFLARLLQAAAAGERTRSVIEILILQALAYQAQGDIPAALGPLERALTLAEPEGYVRVFVDEGEAMRKLIAEFRMRGPEGAAEWPTHPRLYADKLWAAFDQGKEEAKVQETIPPFRAQGAPAHSGVPSGPRTIVEPLSQRELEVLRLFKTELSGPEIARELVIGLSTVRTHTKSIFSKLNVNSRRAAVKRAADLNLI